MDFATILLELILVFCASLTNGLAWPLGRLECRRTSEITAPIHCGFRVMGNEGTGFILPQSPVGPRSRRRRMPGRHDKARPGSELRRSALTVALDKAVGLYLEQHQLLGHSAETMIWYAKKLKTLVEFAAGLGISETAGLTLELGRQFVKGLQDRPVAYSDHPFHRPEQRRLAPVTVAGFARAIRAWATWLCEEGYTADNVFQRLPVPRVPTQTKRPLTRDEIRAVMQAIPRTTPEGMRNSALVMFLLDSAPRVAEASALRLPDLDLKGRTARVMGKGSRERILPIGIDTARALRAYIEIARPQPAREGLENVFLTGDGQPLTRDAIEKIFDRIEKTSGVRVHPHKLRRTAAVEFIRNGGDAFALQRLLGHSTMTMTRVYTELADETVQEVHGRASPVDNLDLTGRRRGRPRKVWRRDGRDHRRA